MLVGNNIFIKPVMTERKWSEEDRYISGRIKKEKRNKGVLYYKKKLARVILVFLL